MDYIAILTQLGYTPQENVIEQMKQILSKCDLDSSQIDNIIALNDKLKTGGAFIAMSNSNPYLKIKNVDKFGENSIIEWANKHKIRLEKVESKNTFYILGRQI